MCKVVRCVLCFSEIHSNLSELEAEVSGFYLFYLYFLRLSDRASTQQSLDTSEFD